MPEYPVPLDRHIEVKAINGPLNALGLLVRGLV
jgi:hypothetical protein